MNDKLNLEVTIKPALTVERIREELADMVGLPVNDETRAEMVRRLLAIGLFDFNVKAEPVHDSDCSTNNHGVPELLGPCDCSLSQAKQHVVELPTMSQVLGPLPAEQRETAKNVLLMCKQAVLDSGAAVKMGAWTEGAAAVAELAEQAMQDVDGGKTYTHEEAKQLMAERRAKVAASHPTCTDERPCVNCFSGQGECLADQGVLSKIVSAELVKAQSGDLVIFRVDAGTVTADDVEPLSKYLHAKLPAGVICMVVVGDVEITSMSEEQLKQVGLVRVGGKESDDLTQFLEQTDFDAAEKVASDTVANQLELPAGEDDCDGCRI